MTASTAFNQIGGLSIGPNHGTEANSLLNADLGSRNARILRQKRRLRNKLMKQAATTSSAIFHGQVTDRRYINKNNNISLQSPTSNGTLLTTTTHKNMRENNSSTAFAGGLSGTPAPSSFFKNIQHRRLNSAAVIVPTP